MKLVFDLFDLFDGNGWFDQPFDEMTFMPICKESGYRALEICEVDSTWVSISGLKAPSCAFHQLVHLDKNRKWQVTSNCESPLNMIHKPWFVLPPIEEYYYKSKNPNYQPLPSYRKDCINPNQELSPLQLIYPRHKTKIYIPIDFDGKLSRTVFKAIHRNPQATIHWHLDNTFIGSTENFHHVALIPEQGKHHLTLVDNNGWRLEQEFEILEKK